MLIPFSLIRQWEYNGHIPFRFYQMGYHFCRSLDGRIALPSHVVGPGDEEMENCSCGYLKRPLMIERIDRIVLINDIVRTAARKEAFKVMKARVERSGD
jgi:hypothetical protein